MSDLPIASGQSAPLAEPATARRALAAPTGFITWLSSVDHKQIGIMYMLAALVFFALGGAMALLMRLQLAVPENTLVSPWLYNGLFTTHGTIMVFFFGMPAVFGFANYLVPLMIGANDVAFPRLNAFSFWVFLFSGLLLCFSVIAGALPDVGWYAYPPLTLRPYTLGQSTDYWALALFVSGLGSVAGAVNLIATILTMRAPGMTLRRLPVMVWMILFTMVLIVFAIPSLNAALVMTFFDRYLGTHFFAADPANPGQSGSVILYQHLFWNFGHPEVYILVLPFFGIISEVIPVFARKPLFGYTVVVASSAAIMLLSLLVWGHHMFASGLGLWEDIAFALTTAVIAVPTGVKIFNWVATAWGGTLRFTTAMLFALAFLVTFPIGGVTGVQFSVVPFDRQVTDTYYLVAHLHYVLFGGSVYAAYAGIYYWYPKVTGRLLDERLGQVHFWTTMLGFNLTFFIQHVLGWYGMPRRVYTYPDLPGWGAMNMLSTAGSFVLGASVLVLVWNLIVSFRRGAPAGDNPWDAYTLEWATASPPPEHNFARVPPVRGRRPVWDLNHPELAEAATERAEGRQP